MAKNALSTPTSTPVTGRRRLAGGLFAIAAGGTLTSGIAAGFAAAAEPVQSEPDAELIAACGRFCQLERDFDVACRIDDENETDVQTRPIIAMSDALAERIIAMPCTSLGGVQALARALAAWDRELLTNAPAEDMGELITSHLVERLLALSSEGA